MKKQDNAYYVEQVDAVAEREPILALWGKGKFSSPEIYDWYYIDNNLGDRDLFVLRISTDNRIIGTMSITEREWWAGNKLRSVGIMGNLFIDQAHRTMGPAAMLTRYVRAAGMEKYGVIYGFPKKNAEVLFKYVGFNKLDALTRYAKVLNATSFLSGKYPFYVARPAGFMLNCLIRLEDKYLLRGESKREISVTKIPDELHESLNDQVSEDYMRCSRTRDYLQWRYIDIPEEEDYSIFSMYDKKGEMIDGYVVFWLGDDNCAYIMDFLARGRRTLRLLLLRFSKEMRKKGYRSISTEYLGTEFVLEIFRRLRFIERDERDIYYSIGDSTEDELRNLDWYITSGDENSRN